MVKCRLCHEYFTGLRLVFDTRGHIDRMTNNAILCAFFRANIAGDHFSRVDANANTDTG